MRTPDRIPEGFIKFPTDSPYFKNAGPFFFKRDGDNYSMGFVASDRHMRHPTLVAGGALFILADIAQGHAIATAIWTDLEELKANGYRLVTIRLNTDCISSRAWGDWIQADVTVTRIGSNVAFSRAVISTKEKVLMTSNATYTVRPATHTDTPTAC